MRPSRKKRELANWIRRRLGQPVIDVLIDTTQIDDQIDFAVDYFGQHAGGIGHEESILLICPEQVKYDATGKPCQPKPTKGRWRKKVDTESCATTASSGTSGTPGTSGTSGTSGSNECAADLDCDSITPVNTTDPDIRYGGPDRNPNTNFLLDPCCPEETNPGPGWCNDNIQEDHCFTETQPFDPNADGPYWVEGDTTVPPKLKESDDPDDGFVFKTVYDIPKDVTAIVKQLPRGRGTGIGGNDFSDSGEALFSPMHLFLNNGGLGLGAGGRFGGGFVDLVGLELGLQYIEMFRIIYTVRMNAQLLELEHKVRISPPPTNQGVIALSCYRKVADEAMYEHIWVREYAEALCLYQVGMNAIKYNGATFPGGASINAQFYIDKGEAKREKLENELITGKYAEPPEFFWG